MVRARFGSFLGVLCSTLLALSLLLVIDPRPWVFFWSLCGALLVSSVGLWFRNRWARLSFLLIAGFLLVLYAAEIELAPGGCAGTIAGCYSYYIQHDPLLAVAHYFAYLTCSHPLDLCCSERLIRCHKLSMYVQPTLTLLAMIVVLKPLASNNLYGACREVGPARH
jgi:hypothetical protein